MKGRPIKDGDEDPRARDDRAVAVASMKGRPIKDGDPQPLALIIHRVAGCSGVLAWIAATG